MAEMKEEWRDIKGLEGRYQVSTLGQVRTVKARINDSLGRPRTIRSRIRKQQLTPRGYYAIMLKKGGRCSQFLVHQLVAQTFISPRQSGYEVDHINGQRDDNRVENLRWLPRSDNRRLRHKVLNKHGVIGVRYFAGRRKPWCAQTCIRGKSINLGYFKTKFEAAEARKRYVEDRLHG